MAEQMHHPIRQSDRIRERTQLLKFREDADTESLAQEEKRARFRDQGHLTQSGSSVHNLAETGNPRVIASPRRSKASKSSTLTKPGGNKTNVMAKSPPLAQLAGVKRKGSLEARSSEPETCRDDSGDDYFYEEHARSLPPQKRITGKKSTKTKSKSRARPSPTKPKRKGESSTRRKLFTARGQKVPLEEMTLHLKNADRTHALVELQPPQNDIKVIRLQAKQKNFDMKLSGLLTSHLPCI